MALPGHAALVFLLVPQIPPDVAHQSSQAELVKYPANNGGTGKCKVLQKQLGRVALDDPSQTWF
jgi:hypothetical protein